MQSKPASRQSPIATAILLAALEGDARAAKEAYERSLRLLTVLARRHAPWLSPDLHLEIVQETWQLFFARRDTALLSSGDVNGAAYLNTLLRNAVEAVKSKDRPPGTRSRRTGAERETFVELAPGLENDESNRRFAIEQRGQQIRLDIERLMLDADEPVRAAVFLMLESGVTLSNAASLVGMSRQTLGRRLQRLRLAA